MPCHTAGYTRQTGIPPDNNPSHSGKLAFGPCTWRQYKLRPIPASLRSPKTSYAPSSCHRNQLDERTLGRFIIPPRGAPPPLPHDKPVKFFLDRENPVCYYFFNKTNEMNGSELEEVCEKHKPR